MKDLGDLSWKLAAHSMTVVLGEVEKGEEPGCPPESEHRAQLLIPAWGLETISMAQRAPSSTDTSEEASTMPKLLPSHFEEERR